MTETEQEKTKQALSQKRKAHRATTCDVCGHPLASHHDFPAIVIRLRTSRLYRVVVGPFADADSTQRIQRQLSEQGFESFRTTWNPSAQ